jgi:hypothetical protein
MTKITREPLSMVLITRVGVDLAKNVIQVHAVDKAGRVVVAKALKRAAFMAWCSQLPAGCVVAMEACSGAHAWGRRLRAVGMEPKLIAPSFVSPYRMEGKSGKNDMTDAAAVCEAASRPTMRFVPIKSAEQQSVMGLHSIREGFKKQRNAVINQIRGVLTEFELVFGKSPKALRAVLADVLEDASNELTGLARQVLLWTTNSSGVTSKSGSTSEQALMPSERPRSWASESSGHRRSRQQWQTSRNSKAQINSAPGWASCPDRTPAEAKPAWGASPSAGMTICAPC